jgi:hypothetical protein
MRMAKTVGLAKISSMRNRKITLRLDIFHFISLVSTGICSISAEISPTINNGGRERERERERFKKKLLSTIIDRAQTLNRFQ